MPPSLLLLHVFQLLHTNLYFSLPLFLSSLSSNLSLSFSILKDAFFNCCPPHPLLPHVHLHFLSCIWTSYHQTLSLCFYLIFLHFLHLICSQTFLLSNCKQIYSLIHLVRCVFSKPYRSLRTIQCVFPNHERSIVRSLHTNNVP